MKTPEQRQPAEFNAQETRTRQLGYTPDFKTVIAEHPGIGKKVVHLIDRLSLLPITLLEVEEGGIKVSRAGGHLRNYCFRVEFDNYDFFIKKQKLDHPELQKLAGGFPEIVSSAKAKELIKDIPGVRVINFALGYSDRGYNNYFVSQWENLENLSHYLKFTCKNVREKSSIKKTLEVISKRLSAYHELGPENMFYDPVKKEIVLYDLVELQP